MAKRSGGKKKADEPAAPFDRRMMEKQMQEIQRLLSEHEFKSIDEANAFLQQVLQSGKGLPAMPPPDDPLVQAQELVYEALETRSPKKRIELAHKALSISEDCADAYVLLAQEEAKTLEEQAQRYEEAVRAGERALGPEAFEEDAGHFWGLLETRPYMRARAGLAQCLWELGERPEAIAHVRDMLRLNPGDNQGLRYVLADWLLAEGDDEGLGALLDDYPDDAMATWAYSRALLAYRRQGESPDADLALDAAFEANPHVPSFLLGRKRLPKQLPAYIGLGDESEAVEYVVHHLQHWQRTHGALRWMRHRAAEKRL